MNLDHSDDLIDVHIFTDPAEAVRSVQLLADDVRRIHKEAAEATWDPEGKTQTEGRLLDLQADRDRLEAKLDKALDQRDFYQTARDELIDELDQLKEKLLDLQKRFKRLQDDYNRDYLEWRDGYRRITAEDLKPGQWVATQINSGQWITGTVHHTRGEAGFSLILPDKRFENFDSSRPIVLLEDEQEQPARPKRYSFRRAGMGRYAHYAIFPDGEVHTNTDLLPAEDGGRDA